MTLPELIKALEDATGPSRELDVAIDMTLWPNEQFMPWNPSPQDWVVKIGDKWVGTERQPRGSVTSADRYCMRYTASVDAAIALCDRVSPGANWTFRKRYRTTKGRIDGHVYDAQVSGGDICVGGTEAIALCLAILRAKLSEADHG